MHTVWFCSRTDCVGMVLAPLRPAGKNLRSETQSACGAICWSFARYTQTCTLALTDRNLKHTQNDCQSPPFLSSLEHINTATVVTERETAAPVEGWVYTAVLYIFSTTFALLLWKFPAVAPWLVVSADDVTGVSLMPAASFTFNVFTYKGRGRERRWQAKVDVL